MARVLAAADVGSNTVHLLVASVGPKGLVRLENQSEWLSLGQVVSHEGEIPASLVESLVQVMGDFRRRASALGAESLYVFATEAVRRARNHGQVLALIKKNAGVKVEIIPPSREAELALAGATIDADGPRPFDLVEAGGGSVQVAHVEQVGISSEISLPLGTGFLTDRFDLTFPADPGKVSALRDFVRAELERVPRFGSRRMVACGGVARGFLRSLHRDGDPHIHRRELEYLVWAVERLRLDQIEARFHVGSRRAATLLPGAVVYWELMARLGHDCMTISEFGVREGAIKLMAEGKIES